MVNPKIHNCRVPEVQELRLTSHYPTMEANTIRRERKTMLRSPVTLEIKIYRSGVSEVLFAIYEMF